MKKKVLALVLVVALVAALTVGLVACNDGNGDPDTLKIGVLHIGKHTDTEGYTAAHQAGINQMMVNCGISESQMVYKDLVDDKNAAAVTTAIDDLIAEGCDVIIGTSFGYQGPMLEAAKANPEIFFSHGTGYLDNENMNNYFGRIYQARYLSGIVAGLKAKELGNDQLGYVAAHGTEVAETCSGINAFTLGAQAVYPEAKVNVVNIDSWFDPAKEKEAAVALLANCSVITQHSDTKNPCNEASKKENSFSVGYNTDMMKALPSDTVLTSVIWHWGVYYTKLIKAVQAGTQKQLGNYYGEYSEGLFGLAELSTKVAPETQQYLDLVIAQMNKGAEGRAEWDVFSGKKLQFKTVDGQLTMEIVDSDLTGYKFIRNAEGKKTGQEALTIVAAGGGSVENSVIQGSMNYYVDGVTEA